MLTFDQIENCFPEGGKVYAPTGGLIVSATWLHDFARNIQAALTEPAPVTDAEAQEALDALERLHNEALAAKDGYLLPNDYETIRRALLHRGGDAIGSSSEGTGSRPASGMELPDDPRGWRFWSVGPDTANFKDFCAWYVSDDNKERKYGQGPTPRAAAEAAIAKIKAGE